VLTTIGLSWRSAAVVPLRNAGFARVTVRLFPPAASVTGDAVPFTSIEMPVTVKLTE